MAWRAQRVALAACALAALALLQPALAGVELSNSIIIVSLNDVEPNSGEEPGQRQCEAVIARAKNYASRKLGLVVTAHWSGGRQGVEFFALKNAQGNLVRVDDKQLKRWQEGLTACFKAATAAGFTHLHVLTHIDDASGQGIWRNGIIFDPRKPYGGFSYEQVVLQPAARAAAAAATPDTTVEFVLAGEMGRSMLSFPHSYRALFGPIKSIINSGDSKPKAVLVGVSLNWSRHCGCTGSADLDPVKYNSTYGQVFVANKDRLWDIYDVYGFKQLLLESEFLGMSAYGVLPASGVKPSDFELPIHTLAYELTFWGIELNDVIKGKPLVFSEWGLGGSGRSYGSIAQSSYEAGRFPVHGKWMSYDPNSDPWLRTDLRDYRRQVYDALIAWLEQGGGPTYRVSGVYLWSVGTWDVLNVHPITANARGGFGDKSVQAKVLEHNADVNGL